MQRTLDIGIIGAGTAGAAAAIFLARGGHRVTVHERVPSPRAVGAGITLQPSGLHVLRRLGLADRVIAQGARIDRLLCETRARRAIVDLSYATIAPRLFGVGTHRGVLFEALIGALHGAGVDLRTGVTIARIERAPKRQSWLIDEDETRFGPYDLVIAADGARSTLRRAASAETRAEPYPWGALWFVTRDVREEQHRHASSLRQVVDGNGIFLGLLPTGRAPGGSEPLISLFWSLRCDRVDEWRRKARSDRMRSWKDEVIALAPEATPILETVEDPEQMLFATYHDVVMRTWSGRNFVVLGDAAHATSPQLGQGSNLALWDAMTLADAIDHERGDLVRALHRYCR